MEWNPLHTSRMTVWDSSPDAPLGIRTRRPPAPRPDVRGKDKGVAVLLTMLLGPLGLIYVDPRAGLQLFALMVLLAIPTLMIGPLVIAVISVVKAWRAFDQPTSPITIPGLE